MTNYDNSDIRLRRPLFWLGMAAAIWLVVGCTTVGKERRGIYQSEDYIIYQLQEETTPVALAERFLKDPRRAWVIEEANPGATFQKGKTVIIPLKDDNRAGLFREGYQVVPILVLSSFRHDLPLGAVCLGNVFPGPARLPER